MLTARYYIIVCLLAILAGNSYGGPIEDTRKQLFENQRNIIALRKEKAAFAKELEAAMAQPDKSTDPEALKREVLDIQDSIAVANQVIAGISELVSRQRLLLATLERGTPPTALDIALNKALNSNLPELVKNLSSNEAARKEVSRLKVLLKQQARIGNTASDGNSVSIAMDQQVAEGEFLRLLALFSGGSTDETRDKDKVIKITGTANNKPYTENEILSYLGHDQYHIETTVHSGKMTFTVDGRPWQLNVPKDEHQATYVIIYDISKKEPRLVMFNKSLLLE